MSISHPDPEFILVIELQLLVIAQLDHPISTKSALVVSHVSLIVVVMSDRRA